MNKPKIDRLWMQLKAEETKIAYYEKLLKAAQENHKKLLEAYKALLEENRLDLKG